MKIAFIGIFLFVFTLTTHAQQWLGISPSNYGGTYSVYSNPANIADSRYKCFINLAGADFSVLNNYASWNAPYSMLSLITGKTSPDNQNAEGKTVWKNSYLAENTKEANYQGFLNAEVRGPALLYTFEKTKFSVGLSTRFRFLTNLANVNTNVARLIVEGTNQPAEFGIARADNHLAFNVNALTEIAASLGYVLRDEDENFYKVGFTVKKINGLAHTHVIAENVNYRIDKFDANRQLFALNYSKGQYGLVADEAYQGIGVTQALFGSTTGSGYGFDVGFVYEFRPDYDKYIYREKGEQKTDGTANKYNYRIGVALLDIGAVKYTNPTTVSQVDVDHGFVLVLPGTYTNINTFDKLGNVLNKTYGITDADKTRQFSSPLPMALSVNIDYKVRDNIYVSAVLVQSLRDSKAIGMVQPSMAAITPRYETHWLEISLPVALLNNYQNLTVGLAGRAGPLFVGSDNIGGLLNIGRPMGLDIYAGVFIPILRTLPKSSFSCPTGAKLTLSEKIKSIFKKN